MVFVVVVFKLCEDLKLQSENLPVGREIAGVVLQGYVSNHAFTFHYIMHEGFISGFILV